MVHRYVRKLIQWLEHTKIAKNASVLLIAQILIRGLSIFYIAILARYIHAQGIGQITIATALNGMLALVIAPGLNTLMIRDMATDRAKTPAYIANAILAKVLFGIPFLLLVLLVSVVAGYSKDTVIIIRIYAIVYLVDAFGSVLVAGFEAFERMELEALSLIVQAVINVALSLIAIYLQLSLVAIVVCSLIAQICKLVFMLFLFNHRVARLNTRVDPIFARSLMVSSVPFGMLLILSAIKPQVEVFILSLFRPEAEVGIYSSADSLIIILLFIPTALSTAIFPALSKLATHSDDDLQRYYQVSFKYMLLIGFPLGLGTMLIGDKVVLLIYGNDFLGAVPVIRVLSLFLFTLVGYVNGPLLKAIGKQNFLMWTEGGAVLINVLLCLWLASKWGPVGAAWAFVLAGILTFFVHSWACHHFFHIKISWGTIGKVAISTFLMGTVVSLSLKLEVYWLISAFFLAPLAYCISILGFGLIKHNELNFLFTAESKPNDLSHEQEMLEKEFAREH